MKSIVLAVRSGKEILRDKLTAFFGLGFPLVLLLLLTAIQNNIPVELFTLNSLTPGVAVFGLSFISLFSGMLLSKDRVSAFTMRLFASPLEAKDFLLGYILPFLPLALMQTVICYGAALILGLEFSSRVILAVLSTIPCSALYLAIGLLCGSLLSDKQVGGVCGALLTNLSAWLSGTWFDLEMVGGGFKKVAELLPFYHCVELGRCVLAGEKGWVHLWWVLSYAAVLLFAAILVFSRKMKKG